MRFTASLRKTWIETIRDWKILSMTLAFAPLFIFLMRFYVDEGSSGPYQVAWIVDDRGTASPDGSRYDAPSALIEALGELTTEQGEQLFEIEESTSLMVAQEQLEGGALDLIVHIPEGFSEALFRFTRAMPAAPVVITTYGDPTNANYLMAVVWNDMITYEHVLTAADIQIPVRIEAQSLHSSQALSEFDRYVPGLLILAAMMLMFTAAAALVREKDKGTLVRLRLSRMTTFEWLSAVSLTQLILGLTAIALTYLTAAALGYEASGSLLAGAFVSALASLAIIGISILVAAYLRTIFDLLTVGCFPFFILMFFSGGMFPLPPVRVMSVGTRAIQLNEILPTTHAINALGKILNSGANLSDLGYELLAMGILTVVYFTLGVWIFTRRHMRA